jgi:hypothetical protein
MAASFHVLFFSTNEPINRRQGLGIVQKTEDGPCQKDAILVWACARHLANDELILSILSTFAQYILSPHATGNAEVYGLCAAV